MGFLLTGLAEVFIGCADGFAVVLKVTFEKDANYAAGELRATRNVLVKFSLARGNADFHPRAWVLPRLRHSAIDGIGSCARTYAIHVAVMHESGIAETGCAHFRHFAINFDNCRIVLRREIKKAAVTAALE